MGTEQNKVLVRRFIDEVFVKGNPDAADKLVTHDFTPHSWGKMPPGIEPLKEAIRHVHAGLADVGFKIEDIIAEEDKVAVRVTARAKTHGDFMGSLRAAGNTRFPRRISSTCATGRWPNTGATRTCSA
jgi:predicted SnoaL-like aldol condensation-catalyzing enzyme